ncbi:MULTISPECIES: Holliday junction resolvase RuvX [Christiangramia]|uniref:Putative pre-16S rRNA nuclease n=1 Tax=Christiangramia flava JLT2011 TaxID=1229726 RepID=A0A1L7I6N3_9FLAO|nr:Holliday junction resolvase RuvX [Christiangramia flava]APU69260.1 Putative Holliday junction resolvase YggF [Christiangramia flava JLT2011]OSS38841.1 putative Holliday junction resolvase [Christiangramia flava JLT2011]
MARVLALDYGLKRTGIAVTDELKMIASGLTTVQTPDLIDFLKDYFQKESVERVIIGEPRRMDDSFSENEANIREFLKVFQKTFPEMPTERMDERFTSKMAVQSMIDGGLKKKKRRDKALVDEISATLILQSWLY